jgi:hypothetical protein
VPVLLGPPTPETPVPAPLVPETPVPAPLVPETPVPEPVQVPETAGSEPELDPITSLLKVVSPDYTRLDDGHSMADRPGIRPIRTSPRESQNDVKPLYPNHGLVIRVSRRNIKLSDYFVAEQRSLTESRTSIAMPMRVFCPFA